MIPTRRSASSRPSVLAAICSIFAVACGDVPVPTQLSPNADLAARKSAPLTHPAVGAVSQRIPIAGRPNGVAVSSKGLALVTQLDYRLVAGFRLAQPFQALPGIDVTSGPIDVVFNKAGTVAYVCTFSTGMVHVIDVSKNAVTRTIPIEPLAYRVALSADESRLFIASSSGRLWSIRTHGNPKPTYVDLVAGLSGLEVAPSGAVYVSTLSSRVYRIDPTTLGIDAQMSFVPSSPIRDIALAPDGSALWALFEDVGLIRFLDPTTLDLGASIGVDYWGGRPFAIEFSPDGERTYVTSPSTGTLFIIERPFPNTYNITPVVLGGTPQRIAFGENGAAALVSNEGDWVDIIR